jgi:four helix bundle protein
MGNLVRRFEDLVAWQRAMDLVVFVYEFSSTGKWSRDFGFTDQLRRSAISVSSNIAEGFERNSRADFRRFLAIAKASCGELRSQVHLAMRLQYISQDVHELATTLAEEVSLKIGRLRTSLETRKS